MIQRQFWHELKVELFKCYKMAIGLLHCLKVFRWIKSKKVVPMFEKVGDSESYLFNFSRGDFEEISLIQSYRELNDVPFETRLNYLK